jgi:hypothetical protein
MRHGPNPRQQVTKGSGQALRHKKTGHADPFSVVGFA